ncbi:hypothetical protein NP603_13925 [Methylomonas sp. SURF-1]|uniref:Uncharacterized protein n=1 Tax=Methylomonas aurea TaxID=2952224 RepID=A0ABT1UJK8_9GAMM|nr:hypothetical protein [Methylomonas sp. SURF-1]MCQ8182216.1 hypothetical protein [Methylomonas sp. SURF-1]
MNAIAIQAELDRPGGPQFRGNQYIARVRPQEPTAKYKSHGRNGRNFETKRGLV